MITVNVIVEKDIKANTEKITYKSHNSLYNKYKQLTKLNKNSNIVYSITTECWENKYDAAVRLNDKAKGIIWI